MPPSLAASPKWRRRPVLAGTGTGSMGKAFGDGIRNTLDGRGMTGAAATGHILTVGGKSHPVNRSPLAPVQIVTSCQPPAGFSVASKVSHAQCPKSVADQRRPDCQFPPPVVCRGRCGRSPPPAGVGWSRPAGHRWPAPVSSRGLAAQSLLEFQPLGDQLRRAAVGARPTGRQAGLALLQHPFPIHNPRVGSGERIRRPGSEGAGGRCSPQQPPLAAVGHREQAAGPSPE